MKSGAMENAIPLLVIIPEENGRGFAMQLASTMGYPAPDLIVGTPLDAARLLQDRGSSPPYIVIDIAQRGADVLPEIDALAEHCESGTRVVVIGVVNDVTFYRELKQRGVIEYLTHPAKIADVQSALLSGHGAASLRGTGGGKVITFMGGSAGDGASMAAINVAHCLAHEHKQPTVLVDMDYQFGMVAKNLDLEAPFGIKELFDHPDRGIDATLLSRMLVDYGSDGLKVITAPNDLRMLPLVRPELIRDLIMTLKEKFKYVVIDLPHLWTNWISGTVSNANHNVLVAQLWLKSVNHGARLLGAWRTLGVEEDAITLVVNRSGAKYKEEVSVRDFERVSGHKVDFYLGNDIRTVVEAENAGKTILEIGSTTILAEQIRALAGSFTPEGARTAPVGAKRSPFGGLFKK